LTNNNTDSQLRGSLWQRLLGILGSMNLAILLLLTLCLITLAGTLTEQNQSQAYYTHVYGPFWTAFFQILELFQLYSSPWFLILVSLLILSIATCVWRNSPAILASFGRNSKEYHPGKFSKERQWEVDALSSEKLAELKSIFSKRGYKVFTNTVDDELHIHANKGGQQKLGYLFIHVSILIIFLGGILDANVFMGINLPGYEKSLNSYDVKPGEVPTEKSLPATNSAFSAVRTVSLNQSTDTVEILEKGGYYLQKLPFTIHVNDINSHFYADGSAKDYSAGIEIIDTNGDRQDGSVSAQESLSYKGFTISHRGNAGSNARLQLSMYKFNEKTPLLTDAHIGLPYLFENTGSDRITIDDYRMQNADPSRNIKIGEEFEDIGPSIQYHIMNSEGDVINVKYFLKPYLKDGSKYYLFHVTHKGEKPANIFLPLDSDSGLKRFLAFNHILYEKNLIRLLFSSELNDLFKDLELDSDYLQKQTLNQVMVLLEDYALYGREFAINNQIQGIKENDQEAASLYMEKILDYALLIVFKQVLIHEQQQKSGNVAKHGNVHVDMSYFNSMRKAVDQFKKLGINYLPVISQHSQEQGVVLSVTRHPGKYVVLGGMFALVLGVLMIFYINYREYLIRIRSNNGKAEIRVNAYTNRSDVQFGREFTNLTDVLVSVTL
jgi:cytochrome c biogenesis protein